MPTAKNRLNITLSHNMETAIEKLAKRDRTSRAGKAAELLSIAIEIEEDRLWNELAQRRDVPSTRFLTHKKAWK